jgi:HK97 family phage portal protein
MNFDWLKNLFATKRVYDVARVGIAGRPQYPPVSIAQLLSWYRRHELVYACIQKTAQAAIDPELILERRNDRGEYTRLEGHPFVRLLNRPNENSDGAQFISDWLVSEQVAGVFYAEIVRNRAGMPTQLYPINPLKFFPVPDSEGHIVAYQWKEAGNETTIVARDILASRLSSPFDAFNGLSPLAVALGSIDADAAQTDYLRAFFNNDGTPTGILKISGRNLTPERADEIRQRWMQQYTRNGKYRNAPAVLDENAEYQKIGANIQEIEANTIRAVLEARICSVFGVPPLLVGAYVGLLYVNQRAAATQAQTEFWANKLSPTFKRLRNFLTWNLLTEFESEEDILSRRVRLRWDMSNVVALREDEQQRQIRIRENYRAGLLTYQEARAQLGVGE